MRQPGRRGQDPESHWRNARLSAASSGSATAVNWDPMADVASAAHKRAKSALQATPRARFTRSRIAPVSVPLGRGGSPGPAFAGNESQGAQSPLGHS
jgi:hypothetical protein